MRFSELKWVVFIVVMGIAHFSFGQIKIDHVIAVVNDLDSAKAVYRAKGFLIKEGRLHSNGLLNAHVKFGNQSSLELMTVKGEATDELSQQYQSLLRGGEGGVFLALTGHHHDSLKVQLQGLGISFMETSGKLWSYLSFSQESYLAHIFFISYHFDVDGLQDPTNHPNGITGIQTVEVEGGSELDYFFRALGLSGAPDYFTSTGTIRVVSQDGRIKRPRLVSVTLEGPKVSLIPINWRR